MRNKILRKIINILFFLMRTKTREDIYNKFETFGDLYYSIKNKSSEYNEDKIKNYIFKVIN